jgi:pimeloyl-ACP methyl ester carboxylesterase
MHKQIKGSKIVFINGAGHEIYVDKAEECYKELDAFIDSVNGKSK